MRGSDTVVLYSGGIDSFCAWSELQCDTVYMNLGHRYSAAEEKAIDRTIPKTMRIKSLCLGAFEGDDADIPGRNMYLAMYAANLGYSKICLVAQKDEMAIPDRSARFYRDSSTMLSFLYDRPIEVFTPYEEFDKFEIIRRYISAGGNTELLMQTWACYQPRFHRGKFTPCYDCGACFRRVTSFMYNDIVEDKDGYRELLQTATMRRYRDKLLNNEYSKDRTEKTMIAIQKLERL